MARLVVKNRHKKDMCSEEIDYVLKVKTPFWVQLLTRLGGPM